MAMVTRGPIRDVYFGFNLQRLLIRIDFDERAREALADFGALRIGFVDPAGWEILIEHPSDPGAKAELRQQAAGLGPVDRVTGVEIGIDRIVELAVPFELLGVQIERS
jgi:hypothetical protein